MKFEQNLARLEEIVGQLDSDSITLNESLKLFEEGIELLRQASTELSTVEARVKLLVEEADGIITTKEFDA
jgi:exodeoxyribonuclease VII small subunit